MSFESVAASNGRQADNTIKRLIEAEIPIPRIRVLVLLAILLAVATATLQTIRVIDRTLCNKKPAKEIQITLYEHDRSRSLHFSRHPLVDPNDWLNATTSDAHGVFSIYGEEDELTRIKPFICFTHRCDANEVGFAKFCLKLPGLLSEDGLPDSDGLNRRNLQHESNCA